MRFSSNIRLCVELRECRNSYSLFKKIKKIIIIVIDFLIVFLGNNVVKVIDKIVIIVKLVRRGCYLESENI